MSANTIGVTFPQQFGLFTLEALLGKGGFGTVYRAVDRRFKKTVALKVMSAEWRSNAAVAEQFRTSVAVYMNVDHPHVCKILDHGAIDGIPYLSMPIYPGGSLRERMADLHDPWDAVSLVHGLVWTMHEVHKDANHLDLKPENILFTADDQAIVVDFGCALRHDQITPEKLRDGRGIGSPRYMAPEQIPLASELGDVEISRACDIWALGVILYELLAGRLPFAGETLLDYLIAAVNHEPKPPSRYNARVPHELDALCLRALAKHPDDRFPSMEAFAAALAEAYDAVGWRKRPPSNGVQRPRVQAAAFRYQFTGYGMTAPRLLPRDRLFLDVGGDLRPGVIDHHQTFGSNACSTRLVLEHPAYLDEAVASDRADDAPFTILVHQEPDLDCVGSALLARAYLMRGGFPAGAEKLAEYLDGVDAGEQGDLATFRTSLYVAYQMVTNRLSKQRFATPRLKWEAQLREGMTLAEAVLAEAVRAGRAITAVDAFAVAGGPGDAGRAEVDADEKRYLRMLKDSRCRPRVGTLRLPDRNGIPTPVRALLLREIPNNPHPCEMLKVWARADAVHSGNGVGFVALSVFLPDSAKNRCIISVTPDSGVNLEGLGARLEQAEHKRRLQVNGGTDDREYNLMVSNERLPDRPGYANPDPWYDGRAHDYTIVDAPNCGTVLSADEIEQIVRVFGKGRSAAAQASGAAE